MKNHLTPLKKREFPGFGEFFPLFQRGLGGFFLFVIFIKKEAHQKKSLFNF